MSKLATPMYNLGMAYASLILLADTAPPEIRKGINHIAKILNQTVDQLLEIDAADPEPRTEDRGTTPPQTE